MSEIKRTREGVERMARNLHESAKKAGNSSYSYEDAKARVERAVAVGEMKRSNNNR